MIVICYDISDDKRLNKLAKFLEEKGIRVQKSVFELDVSMQKANKLFEELKELIDDEYDKLFLFKVGKKEDIQGITSIERIL